MKHLYVAAVTLAVATLACHHEQESNTKVATQTAPPETTTAAAPQGDTFAIPARLETTPSGLQYTIDQPGTGVQPKKGQTVLVHYTGWLADGTKFDSSRDRGTPLDFPVGVGKVIKGWDEAIAAMKVGEKRTLVIPSALGYGSEGYSNLIPPNSTLVFKVELVGVQPQ
jgi:FKBP-type peptidyl-prolyl cis-trans isomerase